MFVEGRQQDRVEVNQIAGPKLTAALWENTSMALAARKTDVFFGPSYTLPLLSHVPRRRVVATHSVNEVQAGAHDWWYDWTYGTWYQLSALSADAVIVPGASTADLVASRYGVPLRKLVVIPPGADTSFRPLDDPELNRRTRIQFLGEDVPYVLFVGSLSVRRARRDEVHRLRCAADLIRESERGAARRAARVDPKTALAAEEGRAITLARARPARSLGPTRGICSSPYLQIHRFARDDSPLTAWTNSPN